LPGGATLDVVPIVVTDGRQRFNDRLALLNLAHEVSLSPS